MNFKIDNLQYCNWSRETFEFNRTAGLDAVHVTIVYHEDYNELLTETKKWEKLFKDNSDIIFQGWDYKDIDKANKENIKTTLANLSDASKQATQTLEELQKFLASGVNTSEEISKAAMKVVRRH